MLSSHPSLMNVRPRAALGAVLAIAAVSSALTGSEAPSNTPPAGEVRFMRDIAPILAQRCFSCHGPKEPEADLRLDTFEGMTKGEHPAVIPGDPEYSGLIQRVTEADSSSRMPRDDDPLTPAQIELISRWIKDGAKFDGPDPKQPYATKPESAKPSEASPHPVHSPAETTHHQHAASPQNEAPKAAEKN